MTTYDTNFDGQKLMYHPARVAEWMQDGITGGPVYTEMELCSFCNCRCIFCGVDYLLGKSHDEMDATAAKRVLEQLAALGNKSVMFGGHGEALLHPRAAEIIACGSDLMSASVTTNGLALDQAGFKLIDGLEWLRFSVNAGNADAYARVHGVRPGLFEHVLENIQGAVARKKKLGLTVTLGVQLVLLEENADSVAALAAWTKASGADYFSVKPYSQHPLSETRRTVDSARFAGLEAELRALESPAFKVIYRAGSAAKIGRGKTYGKCYGTHFLCFISANGDVWECNVFAGDPRFKIGNIREQSLSDIWTGERRAETLDFMQREMDLAACRDVCRLDECNRYLWRLKHPRPHDNFI